MILDRTSFFPQLSFSRSLFTAVMLAAMMGCVSCGAMTRKIVGDATPAAVESGLKTATSAENQQQLVESLDPEIFEEATSKAVSGSTDGLIAALSDEQRQEHLAAAMQPLVASLVDASVDSALNEGNLARIRELAKQATLGFQDAIDEVEQQKTEGIIPEDKGNVLEAANDVAEGGDMILYGLGALAAVLAVLLAAGTWWAMRKKRSYEAESARRDQEIAKITQMLASEGLVPAEDKTASSEKGEAESGDEAILRGAMRRVAERKSSTGESGLQKQ